MATATSSDLTAESLAQASIYIGGEWHTGGHAAIAVDESATGRILAEVPSATSDQTAAALDAARAAQTGWERTGASEKGTALRKIAALLRENADELTELIILETGKAQSLSAAETEATAQLLSINAEWDRRIEGEILPSDNQNEIINLLRVPVGVVVAICAWNWPLAIWARKVAPALVAGNTVVVKPSEVTPLATIAATKLIAQSGILPDGVLNLVTGGTEVGQDLVRSQQTNMVTFTGHRDTGKAIMGDAAPNLTRVALELGGKAAAIVCADANLDTTIPALVSARFQTTGQQCGAAERILVERPIYDEFVKRYVDAVSALRIGDPRTDPDIGPLVCAEQRDSVESVVELAKSEGATVLTGGSRPQGSEFEHGHWFSPTVLGDVTTDMTVSHVETFGPVIPITVVDSLQEAFEAANNTRYGLAGYIYTTSYSTVMEATRAMHCGELFVNRSVGEAMHAHHAGQGESGIGGEDGKHGLLKFTELRVVYHNW